MRWGNLTAVVLAGLLGAVVGRGLGDHLNLPPAGTASLALIGAPSSVFATCAWGLVSRVRSPFQALGGLLVTCACFAGCTQAPWLSMVLIPVAIVATGGAIGGTLKQRMRAPYLPALGLALGAIAVAALWIGTERGYWEPDRLLPLWLLTYAWVQALALEGMTAVGRRRRAEYGPPTATTRRIDRRG